MTKVGFEWTLWISAILCFLYAPFLVFLRDPPAREEVEVSFGCSKFLDFINVNFLVGILFECCASHH